MDCLKTATLALTAWAMTTGIGFITPQIAQAEDYAPFSLAPGFAPNPVVGTGLSGGDRVFECRTSESQGNTVVNTYVDAADAPNHVVTITRPFNNLQVSVQSDGDVTIVVEGPDGTFCSDDVDGLMPSISGSWASGTYNIWIGDFVGDSNGTYRYQLVLTQE